MQLGDSVAPLVTVYGDIRSHHLDFRTVILHEIVGIARILLQHTSEAGVGESIYYYVCSSDQGLKGLLRRPLFCS